MHKILLIESAGTERDHIVELLEQEKFELIVAATGETGLELAQQHRPDLILCALDLEPQADHQAGLPILRAMRLHPELTVIPFVLLTHNPDPIHQRQVMAMGADDCLSRPISDSELIAAIATRLSKQAAITERYITVLRNTAEQLNRLANYDSLTDLPNHRLLSQRLSQLIDAHEPVALLSISLDRLRQVNNTLGYPAGDELLRAAARRLKASLPSSITVARLTGNQFAIILVGDLDSQTLMAVADDLMGVLSQSFSLPGQEVFITTSIGIALCPQHSQDLPTLLRQADAALDWAKQQKSNYCQIYRADMPVVSGDQITLETWLRYALERNEFQVFYQPQMTLGSGRIDGAEALIRWNHPTHGDIPPGRFIPLTEETGLIVPIGEWVLRMACRQAQAWNLAGLAPFQVSVNLSSVQFNHPRLGQSIAAILAETGIDPSTLELELTETALMQDAETAMQTLQELKQLGVRLALDDFGTGYSSLSYLKHLPIDTLKIDHCFVQGCATDQQNQVILQSVIALAHRLDLSVVAEGIETEADLDFLQRQGCDVGQGHLIGLPSDAELLRSQLQSRYPTPFSCAISPTQSIITP
jgi:diguanylate cyclase (GGDEF)-like protein